MTDPAADKGRHVVIGAGPAGLTAAWQLAQRGEPVLVLESDPEQVGGLARTVRFRGHNFDVGPHRFYTKSDEILAMWRRMLPHDFVEVERLTRIYYEGKFYAYPIRLGETLRNLGPLRALKVAASYAKARAFPRRSIESFEDWVVSRFGSELYRTFFKTYTEKVWGVPCSEIDKDWAAQRIRGLSLFAAVRAALFGTARSGVKSLVERFLHPRGGAGQLWESVLADVLAAGNRCELGAEVVRLEGDGGTVRAATTADGRCFAGARFYSTMTLRDLARALDPPPPPEVARAAAALRQRDFLVVALLVEHDELFPDQWIYVHDPGVAVARISNFENWNQTRPMPPPPTRLALEYFFDRDHEFWRRSDDDIVAVARGELERIGLVPPGTHSEGRVIRVLDAYPVYDHGYAANRAIVRDWLNTTFTNLAPAGRRGLHNYNSQDHAMLSATLAVRNQLGEGRYDVWSVNTEQEYAEEVRARPAVEERFTPRRLQTPRDARDGATRPPRA